MRKIRIERFLSFVFIALMGLYVQAAPLDEVFRSFHTIMGVTNVSVDTYMFALPRNMSLWRKCNLSVEEIARDFFLKEWFFSLVSATVPDNVDRDATNCWLSAKNDVIDAISHDRRIKEDTNCWFAVAREMGNVRAGFKTEHDWEVLLGIDGCEREILPYGVVLISITNSLEESRVLSRKVRMMKEDQNRLDSYTRRIANAFGDFTQSQTFRNLSPDEHNSISSNLVETGRLNPYEIDYYGLTNIVQDAGSD